MVNDTALMIIDVQKGMFLEEWPIYRGPELLNTLKDLLSRARAAGMPVIFIQHDATDPADPLLPGSPGHPIHPDIAPLPTEPVIRKLHPDAFQGTSLQAELEARGIRKLIIAGIQTEFCVDTSIRRAYSLGYEVTLVQDAHSTWDTEHLTAAQIIAHHNLTLSGWFAKLTSAAEVTF